MLKKRMMAKKIPKAGVTRTINYINGNKARNVDKDILDEMTEDDLLKNVHKGLKQFFKVA